MTTRQFTADQLIKIRAAKAWRPAPDDQITGSVVVVVPRESSFGRYPVVVLDTGQPSYTAVHAFHQLAEAQLRDLRVAPDMDITMRYLGQETSKTDDGKGGKRTYHNYSIVPAAGAEIDVYDYTDAPLDNPVNDPGF